MLKYSAIFYKSTYIQTGKKTISMPENEKGKTCLTRFNFFPCFL